VRLGESVQRERSDDWTTGECCDGRCLHFAEKCVFREFMKKRLIPADGFYELEVDWPL
jgi:putative SOS response-associated peptidase YedK